MEIEMLVVQNFEQPVDFLSNAKLMEMSPTLDKLLILHNNNEVSVVTLYPRLSSLWISTAKYNNGRFSEDGKKIILITKSDCMIVILKCEGRHITEEMKKPFSEFVNVNPEHKFDKGASSDFLQCVHFTKNSDIILSDHNVLAKISCENWITNFVRKFEQVVSVKVLGEVVFVLLQSGHLLQICIESGENLRKIDLTCVTSEETNFKFFSVYDVNIAFSDSNDQIYICDLKNLTKEGETVIESCAPIQRLSSSADQIAKQNVPFNQFRIRSGSYPNRNIDIQHQKSESSGISEDSFGTCEFALVTALDGFYIKALSLSSTGLSVWYCSNLGSGIFRVYNMESGACIAEESMEHGNTALLRGFINFTDLIISPLSLQLYLCNVSKTDIAEKVVQCVGAAGLIQVLQGPGWQDVKVALIILAEGIAVRQLDITRFALKIHSKGFKIALATPHTEAIVEKNLLELQNLLFCGIEDNLHSPQLAENLVMLSLNHCYDLLGILYESSLTSRDAIDQALMNVVVRLRAYLYQVPEPTQVQESSSIPLQLQGLSENAQELWNLWTNLPDEEIIYQAIDHGFIPLAQTYFVISKNISILQAANIVYETVNQWVLQLLRDGQVTKCQKIYKNLGVDPMSEFKKVYLSTSEEKLQSFLFGYLSNHGVLTEDEVTAGIFLRHLKRSLTKNLSPRHQILTSSDKLQLTPGFVLEQSLTWRDLIYAELVLNLDDDELVNQVKPSSAWTYLLITNRPDLLQRWIDLKFSTPSGTSPLNNIFLSWDILTEMIESIINADCTKFTKDLVLDHLSQYGIFCSSELNSLSSILIRFVRTNNVLNIQRILSQSSAKLSYFDFSTLMLKFCVQHKLSDILFSCLKKSDNLNELVSLSNVPQESLPWLQSWLDLVYLPDAPENLIKAIDSSLEFVAGGDVDQYLEQNPLLAMTKVVLSDKPISLMLSEEEMPQSLLNKIRTRFPILNHVLTTDAWENFHHKDVTLYELLEKASVFEVSRLFGWQKSHMKKTDDAVMSLPHFSSGSVFEKFAYNEVITYEYYLKKGRPTHAFCIFILEQFRYYKKLNKKRKKEACNIAHGLALSNFCNSRVVAACVSFVEMLTMGSDKMRLHVTVGNIILQSGTSSEAQVGDLLQRLLYNHESVAPQMLNLLESSLVPVDLISDKSIEPLQRWSVAIKFARAHHLTLPESLPNSYLKADMWLHFVICVEIFQYPLEQVFLLIDRFTNKNVGGHMFHAFSRPTAASPKKELRFKLRDSRKFLYSKIGLKVEDKSNDSCSESGVAGSSWSTDSSSLLGVSMVTSSVVSIGNQDQLFSILISCHASLDPPHSLLSASLTYSSPILAVLASCYEPCCLTSCMCTWLVVSMPSSIRSEVDTSLGQQIWSASHVHTLCVSAVALGYVNTLNTAFSIFLPESPLYALSQFLKQCVIDQIFDESAENIQLFKTKCQNLPVSCEEDFVRDRRWIYKLAVHLICTALDKSFPSSFHQHQFLQLLCQNSFSEYLPVECPNFDHLRQLQECILETGVHLDFSSLYQTQKGYERELQLCLERLISGEYFNQALKLADTAGLTKDVIVVAQWNKAIEELQDSKDDNSEFWNKCQTAFNDANIETAVAGDFFHRHAETRKSKSERYKVLRLSHNWYTLTKQQSPHKRPDYYLTKSVEVELEMWRERLRLHGSSEIEAEPKEAPKVFTQLRKEVMAEAGAGFMDLETKLEDDQQIVALNAVIGDLLDQGQVAPAVRLAALFSHQNKDIQLLLTCLSLAEGEIQPCQLSSEQKLLIERTFAPSSSFKRRPLHSLRLSSLTSSMSVSPHHSLLTSSEYVDVPGRERQDTLTAVEKLSDRLQHGRAIGARVAACYRVSLNIKKSYADVVSVEDSLGLLKSAVGDASVNKFAVASDLCDQISKQDMAQFLCEEIMAAVSKGHMQGDSQVCCFPSAGGLMWGCELDSSFHLILELCPESSLLGANLLKVSTSLNASHPDAAKQVHWVVVELLIRAHDCYTAACDMEGISQVLQKARLLTSSLLQHQQWTLMVRLVTGIGRYIDMSYILQILKDHDNFEYLLGKGMDKVPGLKLALLEFVRSKCGQDKELLRLVALHFRLYSEVAELWESDAKITVQNLLNVMKLELGTRISPLLNLKTSTDTLHLLKLAMQNFSHAAEYYLQADKLTKAMQAAHNAELVALQISLGSSVSSGQLVDNLLEQGPTQVSYLICHKLSFPQAAILARAYGHPVDWAAALYEHCVVKRDKQYLNDFMSNMTLAPALVEDMARRFQRESSISQDMARMMKHFVSVVQCVEVKYRVASQLGFKDILEEVLSGPDLPYLKDTVWRRGLHKYY